MYTPQTPHRWSRLRSMADFFSDSPWLDIPPERAGEILIKPLHPQYGLLGGASKSDSAPKSKLAALAAARRAKENRKPEEGGMPTSSVALLDKLEGISQAWKPDRKPDFSTSSQPKCVTEAKPQLRKYPLRRPKDTNGSRKSSSPEPPAMTAKAESMLAVEEKVESVPIAAPSTFARTMFGLIDRTEDSDLQSFDQHATQAFANCTEFDFTGPSPDDIVLDAQNSKNKAPKPVKQVKKSGNGDASVNDLTQGVEDVNVEEQKVKGKNLDVLAVFKESKPKNAANFVVIGTPHYNLNENPQS